MPASTSSKPLFAPLPPFDPAKRARAIRDAIAKGKIKRTGVTYDILVLLDQIVVQEKQSA